MTLTSLSERKLHPFFSFQQQNCFQKDDAGPHVITMLYGYICFLNPQMKENTFFVQGAKLVAAVPQVRSRMGPGWGQGQE